MSELDDVTDWLRNYQARRDHDRQAACEKLTAICSQLSELGVQTVTIEYDGYGDSGMVEAVTAEAEETAIELPVICQYELTKAAETLLPDGWQDGEGAFGQLILNVSRRQLVRKHNYRIESTEYEEEHWKL